MIAKDHFVFCAESISPVRSDFKDQAELVTQLLFGEVATVIGKHNQWLKVKSAHDQYEGWIDEKQVLLISESTFDTVLKTFKRQYSSHATIKSPWGNIATLRGSFIPEKKQVFTIGENTFECIDTAETRATEAITTVAMNYKNAPYLWGGRTQYGIDCSGFTQAVYRFFEIELPRDASQQEKIGKKVSFDEAVKGDIAFFHNEKGSVTHVGIVLENYSIIHASGRVRIDTLTATGIFNDKIQKVTHELFSINRILSE